MPAVYPAGPEPIISILEEYSDIREKLAIYVEMRSGKQMHHDNIVWCFHHI